MCHGTAILWKEQQFLTSVENNISNRTAIQVLLEAIKLSREITVVHCPAHTKSSNKVKRTNKIIQTLSQVGLKYPEVLGKVLQDIGNTPHQPLRLSSTEIVFGRCLAIARTFVPTRTSLLDGDE